MRVLVTGGAGFVGANLCVHLAAHRPDWQITALDNLHRRGSELNLPRLEAAGVAFVRADVRDREALLALDPLDALVECSAEPSVLAGTGDGSEYLVETNLLGAFNCLELVRRHGASLVFLSTSRVYPLAALRGIALRATGTRFEIEPEQDLPGVSPRGISEALPLHGARTLYGATKLAAELLIAEYANDHGVPTVIDRCGVIAGPWQMGKVDQGVFTYWMASHMFGRELRYLGYEGSGRQVRDLLHAADLAELVEEQLADPQAWAGVTVNVGGGQDCSLSLLETTELCRTLTGKDVPVRGDPELRPGDVPLYVSDCTALFERTAWRPRRGPREILADTLDWIATNERELRAVL
jgi:CDP-paratose 2-epimerase